MIEWQSVQQTIQSCRRCEVEAIAHLHVPSGEKRKPPQEPVSPIRLYFVSVAPPWGGAYFWDETRRDAVREGLFMALHEAIYVDIKTCEQFLDNQLFLTPAVKCPSSKNNRDRQPSPLAMRNCASFLRDELSAAKPERILALGRVPFRALCEAFSIAEPPRMLREIHGKVWWVRLGNKTVPLGGTYFPGNNRHRGFSAIVRDIKRIFRLFPND